MGAVILQARADLRGRRLQTVVVALVVGVSAVLLSLGLAGTRLSAGAYERLFERTDGAHLWVYLDAEMVTPAMAEAAVRSVPGIAAATPAMRTVTFTTDGLRQPLFGALAAREWRELDVARPQVVAGRRPAPGRADELLLDRNAAEDLGVGVGDRVPATGTRGTRSLRVVGLSVSAEACPYPLCNPTVVYVGAGTLEELGLVPAAAPGMARLAIGLRLDDPTAVAEVGRAVDGALPAGSMVLLSDWRDTRTFSNITFAFQSALLIVFSVIAMVVAGVLIAVTIGGAVRADTRRIGLLKAVGFTGRQLRALYLVQYVGVAAVAALAGALAAAAVAPSLMGDVAARFGDRSVEAPFVALVVVPAALALAAAVFVLLPVRRAVRMDAVSAIRGTGGGRGGRPGRRWALPAAVEHRLPVPVARGLGDVLATPARSLLIAVGLAATATGLTFSVVADASMTSFLRDPGVGAVPDGDLLLRRSAGLGEEEALALTRRHPDVTAAVVEHGARFQLPGDPAPFFARYRTGDVHAFRRPILDGREARGRDEVLVGYGLARARGIEAGERLTILASGQERSFTVAGVYREFTDLGRSLVVSPGVLPESGYYPSGLLVQLREGADPAAVGRDLAGASGGRLEGLPVDELIPDVIRSIGDVVTRLLMVLAALTVLGVLGSVLLGVQERRRSFGLLKAVGMTPRQVAVSVLAGAAALGVVGIGLGLPFGAVATRVSVDAVLRSLGLGPFEAPLEAARLATVVPLVLAVALLGAWLPARRAAALPTVETLRHE